MVEKIIEVKVTKLTELNIIEDIKDGLDYFKFVCSSKMKINEDKRYSAEYHEADKRSIANKIQIHFNDGSSTEAIEVEYPIGHKRRRVEGIPVLEEKFRRNLELTFTKEKADEIFNLCVNKDDLEQMSIIDFQQMLSLS